MSLPIYLLICSWQRRCVCTRYRTRFHSIRIICKILISIGSCAPVSRPNVLKPSANTVLANFADQPKGNNGQASAWCACLFHANNKQTIMPTTISACGTLDNGERHRMGGQRNSAKTQRARQLLSISIKPNRCIHTKYAFISSTRLSILLNYAFPLFNQETRWLKCIHCVFGRVHCMTIRFFQYHALKGFCVWFLSAYCKRDSYNSQFIIYPIEMRFVEINENRAKEIAHWTMLHDNIGKLNASNGAGFSTIQQWRCKKWTQWVSKS